MWIGYKAKVSGVKEKRSDAPSSATDSSIATVPLLFDQVAFDLKSRILPICLKLKAILSHFRAHTL